MVKRDGVSRGCGSGGVQGVCVQVCVCLCVQRIGVSREGVQGVVAHPPPTVETANDADGTHPTGMHSCLKIERA